MTLPADARPATSRPLAVGLRRQIAAFAGVGLVVAFVEGAGAGPVPATLVGYVGGGVVSYGLNRRHTYASDRPHAEATWRFALVAFVGFLLTGAFMHAF